MTNQEVRDAAQVATQEIIDGELATATRLEAINLALDTVADGPGSIPVGPPPPQE